VEKCVDCVVNVERHRKRVLILKMVLIGCDSVVCAAKRRQ